MVLIYGIIFDDDRNDVSFKVQGMVQYVSTIIYFHFRSMISSLIFPTCIYHIITFLKVSFWLGDQIEEVGMHTKNIYIALLIETMWREIIVTYIIALCKFIWDVNNKSILKANSFVWINISNTNHVMRRIFCKRK